MGERVKFRDAKCGFGLKSSLVDGCQSHETSWLCLFQKEKHRLWIKDFMMSLLNIDMSFVGRSVCVILVILRQLPKTFLNPSGL